MWRGWKNEWPRRTDKNPNSADWIINISNIKLSVKVIYATLKTHSYVIIWNIYVIIWNSYVIIWNSYVMIWNSSVIIWNSYVIIWNRYVIIWNSYVIIWNCLSKAQTLPKSPEGKYGKKRRNKCQIVERNTWHKKCTCPIMLRVGFWFRMSGS